MRVGGVCTPPTGSDGSGRFMRLRAIETGRADVTERDVATDGSTNTDRPTPHDIATAYRLFLGREPAHSEISRLYGSVLTDSDLRRTFLESVEFARVYQKSGGFPKTPSGRTIIHLHIPKSAGTSLNQIIALNFPAAAVLDLDTGSMARLGDMKPASRQALLAIKGHLLHGLSEMLPQATVYVCIVRKPGPRIYSFYKFVKRRPEHPFFSTLNDAKMSFGDFLSFAKTNSSLRLEIDNGQIRRISGLFSPAHLGQEDLVLRKAIVNMFAPDMLFGLTEYFHDTLKMLRKEGVLATIPVRFDNVSPASIPLDHVVGELTSEQKSTFDAFTKWDNWFYDLCEDAFLTRNLLERIVP